MMKLHGASTAKSWRQSHRAVPSAQFPCSSAISSTKRLFPPSSPRTTLFKSARQETLAWPNISVGVLQPLCLRYLWDWDKGQGPFQVHNQLLSAPMTPTVQLQVPFCCWWLIQLNQKIRVPTYFWQRSWRSHETEIGGKLGSIIVTRFFWLVLDLWGLELTGLRSVVEKSK